MIADGSITSHSSMPGTTSTSPISSGGNRLSSMTSMLSTVAIEKPSSTAWFKSSCKYNRALCSSVSESSFFGSTGTMDAISSLVKTTGSGLPSRVASSSASQMPAWTHISTSSSALSNSSAGVEVFSCGVKAIITSWVRASARRNWMMDGKSCTAALRSWSSLMKRTTFPLRTSLHAMISLYFKCSVMAPLRKR